MSFVMHFMLPCKRQVDVASFLKMSNKQNTYSLIGRLLAESSRLLIMSKHLFTLSKRPSVVPTLYIVAKHLASCCLVAGLQLISSILCKVNVIFGWIFFVSAYEKENKVGTNNGMNLHVCNSLLLLFMKTFTWREFLYMQTLLFYDCLFE